MKSFHSLLLSLKNIFLMLTVTLFVAACGSGSSSSNNGAKLTVKPALGGVSAGATVQVFDAVTGQLLGTALTSDGLNGVALGTAVVTLREGFNGVAVVKVSGGPGVTYFDERDNTNKPFGANQAILAVVPSVGAAPASVGVTTLTNMVAANVGVSTTNFSSGNFTPPAKPIVAEAVRSSVVAVLNTFGISGSVAALETLMFAPPVVFGVDFQKGDKLSGAGDAVQMGAILTALANSVPEGVDLITATVSLSVASSNGTLAETAVFQSFAVEYKEVVSTLVANPTVINNTGNTIGVPIVTPPATSSSGTTTGSTSGTTTTGSTSGTTTTGSTSGTTTSGTTTGTTSGTTTGTTTGTTSGTTTGTTTGTTSGTTTGTTTGTTSGTSSSSSSGSSSDPVQTTTIASVFPTDMSVSSPTETTSTSTSTSDTGVSDDTVISYLRRNLPVLAKIFSGESLKNIFAELLGIRDAQAQSNPTKVAKLKGKSEASSVTNVLSGTAGVSTLATELGLVDPTTAGPIYDAFGKQQLTNAKCFGPEVGYTRHPDVQSGSNAGNAVFTGSFPGGDLGMWLTREPDGLDANGGNACGAAQLTNLMTPLRIKTTFVLKLAAAALQAHGAVPTSVHDVTAAMNARLGNAKPAAMTFSSVILRKLSSGGYRTEVDLNVPAGFGQSSSRKIYLTMTHLPTRYAGTTVSEVTWGRIVRTAIANVTPPAILAWLGNGLVSSASAQTGATGATGFGTGASGLKDSGLISSGLTSTGLTGVSSSGLYPVLATGAVTGAGFPSPTQTGSSTATVYSGIIKVMSQTPNTDWVLSSIAYQRDGDDFYVKSRKSIYTGAGANPNLTTADDAFFNSGELNPSRSDRNSAWNWKNDFVRFSAKYKLSDMSGIYSSAWQAGNNDTNSRIFNILISNTTNYSGKAYFGFGDAVQNPAFDGLVSHFYCNWTGRMTGSEDSNYPTSYSYDQIRGRKEGSQSQEMAMNDDGKWVATRNHIRFAPTSTCNKRGVIDTDGRGNFSYSTTWNGATRAMSTDTYSSAPDRDTLHVRASGTFGTYPTYKDLVKAELGWTASRFVP